MVFEMLNNCRRVSLITLLATLAACNTTQVKQQASVQDYAIVDHNKLQDKAEASLQQFEQAQDIRKLVAANLLYKKLYESRPDDVNIQEPFARTTFFLTSLGANREHLYPYNKLYDALHPEIRQIMPAPARLVVLSKAFSLQSQEQQDKGFLDALSRYPYDAFLWFKASEHFSDRDNAELSIIMAARAHALSPEDAEYADAIALAYDDLVHRRSTCFVDSPELLKRTLHYYDLAARLDPQNTAYLVDAARLYQRLNLIPVAHLKAQKAISIDATAYALSQLAETAALLDQLDALEPYFQDNSWASATQKNIQQTPAYAYYLASKNDFRGAAKAYSFTLNSSPNIFEGYIGQWLSRLAEEPMAKSKKTKFTKVSVPLKAYAEAETAWEKVVVDYMSQDNPGAGLLASARNACQRTEAHFYTAMQYWLAGDIEATRRHLHQVKSEKVPSFIETIWAHIFLQHL